MSALTPNVVTQMKASENQSKTGATRLAEEYVNKYPNQSKSSLARLLVRDFPEVFSTSEQARSIVRYVTGANGKKLRENSQFKETFKTWDLPEGEVTEIKPYILPSGKTLVLSDIHVPYHDEYAIELAIEEGLKQGIHQILLNGDSVDFYQISRFERHPAKRGIQYELDLTRRMLDWMPTKTIWKDGNHEERWMKYLMGKAKELIDMPEYQLDAVLQLPQKGIDYVTDKNPVLAGDLYILHGHEYFSTYSPVNPAKGLQNRAQHHTLAGHNHRPSKHRHKKINAESITSWSTGCLCDLHPDYMRYNQWAHGFAIVDHDNDTKEFEVQNFIIENGRVQQES